MAKASKYVRIAAEDDDEATKETLLSGYKAELNESEPIIEPEIIRKV